MSTASNPTNGALSPPGPIELPCVPATSQVGSEALDKILRGLETPFDPNLVEWRVMETSDDGTRAQMTPYADPRAYSDRLNTLFSPAGWSRKYAVQASATVQRNRRPPAAKILVTCELTINCIGANSGTGEEWLDREHALTAAEAQAFKRAATCFGLGRYFYDIDPEWVDLDQSGNPKRIPKLPRWATPKGWLSGLRPRIRKNRRAARSDPNGHSRNGNSHSSVNGGDKSLVPEIHAMEPRIGKRMYRGVLKRVARAWSPEQIHEIAVQQQVLAQMQSADRAFVRLKTVESKIAPDVLQKLVPTLNLPVPAKIDDLQVLEKLVLALEKEAERGEAQS